MKIHYLSLYMLFLLFFSCDTKFKETTIAFGSCSHQYDSLQMWDNVIAHKPLAWIWMGDNIYGDTRDMAIMKEKYGMQKQRLSYQQLMKSMDVYGIWDDHDYGINDGGKEYIMKDESKDLMLDFLDIPKNARVRNRPGAYQSYTIENKGLKIKLILLDTRYFRDTMHINLDAPPLYHPNMEGSILGKAQWSWLEQELTSSDADIHLIGSSIQLIPNDHGWEKWGNFPNERKRFFDLIVKTKPARPIILSGDRHIAEFSKIKLDGLQYPLYEFTSSGLTHSWNSKRPEENEFRIGELIIQKNFGLIHIKHDKKSIQINLGIYGSNNEKLAEISAGY
jgi:alkaline phosphatase D